MVKPLVFFLLTVIGAYAGKGYGHVYLGAFAGIGAYLVLTLLFSKSVQKCFHDFGCDICTDCSELFAEICFNTRCFFVFSDCSWLGSFSCPDFNCDCPDCSGCDLPDCS